MTDKGQDLSTALSRYAVEFDLARLSPADTGHLVDAVVNWIGCSLGGAASPSVDTAVSAYLSLDPNRQYRPLGRTERLGLVDAIALDCLASAATAFDDAHPETVLHPTGPVAAALLGLARMRRISGRDYLAALHVGMEIECRTGVALASSSTGAKRGWYSTGLAGGVGAAAAVGRILGFDAARMRNAFGIAAAKAFGNRGVHGSMMSGYVPALAAVSGFMAAKFTDAGFTCSEAAFAGRNGLLELVTMTPAIEQALAGLGEVSSAALTTFKPYPSGIVTHQVIDACLALVRTHKVVPDGLEALHLRVSRTTADLVARKHPKDCIQAQGSLFYWAAIALTFGAAGAEHNTLALVSSPDIAMLQDRISVEVDETLADDQCAATARMSGGDAFEAYVAHAVGSTSNPMTSAEIDAKFMSLSRVSNFPGRAERLHLLSRNILGIEDVAALLDEDC